VKSSILVTLPIVTLLFATSVAGAEDATIDRDRLRRAVVFPRVAPIGWHYSLDLDGRARDGGDRSARYDVPALVASTEAEPNRPESWLDLATAYRRVNDSEREQECIESAISLLRENVTLYPGNGEPLASLGLALLARGDETGAADMITKAELAPRLAWAARSARGDLLMVTAIAEVAQRRFATVSDALEWLGDHQEIAPRLDPKLVSAAEAKYAGAIRDVEQSRMTGCVAAAIYVRHFNAIGVRAAMSQPDSTAQSRELLVQYADVSLRKALSMLPRDPYAIAMLALADATDSKATDTGDHPVQDITRLPETVRAQIGGRCDELRTIGDSAGTVGARALQALACIHWYVYKDSLLAETALRRSIAKDPSLRQSWDSLTLVLAGTRQWNEFALLYRDWIKHGDSAIKRMRLAGALMLLGKWDDAEKECRTGLSLDAKGVEANLGVAAFVLRRTADDAELSEAMTCIRTAKSALASLPDGRAVGLAVQCDLLEAIALDVSGNVEEAAKKARFTIDVYGDTKTAREILAAIVR